MKIAYIANTTIPSNIASSIHVMRMCQAFADIGHRVTLMCPAVEGTSQTSDPFAFYGVRDNFRILRMPKSNSLLEQTVGLRRWVRWQVRLHSYDVVYTRCQAVGLFKPHKFQRPTVIEAHMLHDSWPMRQLLQSRWLRGLVVISDKLAEDYRRCHNLVAQKVVLARDAADEPQSGQVRPLPGNNKIRCGYIGNLYAGKGIELLTPLAKRCPHVDFHVFGGTAGEVNEWVHRPEVIDCHNLYFHGFIAPHETDAVRLSCDFLLAPYQRVVHGVGGETNIADWMSPLKVFEYMASGKIILASDVPALKEILRHRENALLCAADDVECWAQAIDWGIDHPMEAQRIAARARDEFLEKYSWRARADWLSSELKLAVDHDSRQKAA